MRIIRAGGYFAISAARTTRIPTQARRNARETEARTGRRSAARVTVQAENPMTKRRKIGRRNMVGKGEGIATGRARGLLSVSASGSVL